MFEDLIYDDRDGFFWIWGELMDVLVGESEMAFSGCRTVANGHWEKHFCDFVNKP